MTDYTKQVEGIRKAGDLLAQVTGKENANWVYQAADSIERLRRRVTALELVIYEEMHPQDCADDANRMLVEEIYNRPRPPVTQD